MLFWSIVILFAVLAGWVLYAAGIEPYAVKLTKLRLFCPRLPEAFEGFSILQLSDLHMQQMGRRERLLKKLVTGLKPDIVALTGDLAAEEVSARHLTDILSLIPAREGQYAISGNADIRYPDNWASVKRVLKNAGVKMLENEHVIIRRQDSEMILAGVEDPHTGVDDLPKALRNTPDNTFILLLAHSPVIAVPAIECQVDVVLSGHTHGGQLVLPLFGPLLTRSGYGTRLSSGLYSGESLRNVLEIEPGITQIYTSRGFGASFIPIRFMCKPEVTLIELRSCRP